MVELIISAVHASLEEQGNLSPAWKRNYGKPWSRAASGTHVSAQLAPGNSQAQRGSCPGTLSPAPMTFTWQGAGGWGPASGAYT